MIPFNLITQLISNKTFSKDFLFPFDLTFSTTQLLFEKELIRQVPLQFHKNREQDLGIKRMKGTASKDVKSS